MVGLACFARLADISPPSIITHEGIWGAEMLLWMWWLVSLVNNKVTDKTLVKPPAGSSIFRMLGVTQETTRLRTRNKVKPKTREVSASCIVLFSVVGFQYFYSLSPDVYCAVGRSSPRTSLISFREAFYFVFWCSDALAGSPALSLSPSLC